MNGVSEGRGTDMETQNTSKATSASDPHSEAPLERRVSALEESTSEISRLLTELSETTDRIGNTLTPDVVGRLREIEVNWNEDPNHILVKALTLYRAAL